MYYRSTNSNTCTVPLELCTRQHFTLVQYISISYRSRVQIGNVQTRNIQVENFKIRIVQVRNVKIGNVEIRTWIFSILPLYTYGGQEGPFHSANHSISNLVISNLVVSNLAVSNLNISDLDIIFVLLHVMHSCSQTTNIYTAI